MSTVSLSAAVQAPTIVDSADAQLSSAGPALGFCVRDFFPGVLCDLPSPSKLSDRKTTLSLDSGFPDR